MFIAVSYDQRPEVDLMLLNFKALYFEVNLNATSLILLLMIDGRVEAERMPKSGRTRLVPIRWPIRFRSRVKGSNSGSISALMFHKK